MQAAAEREITAVDLRKTQEAFEKQAATQIELERAQARAAAADAVVERTEAAEERARLAYESEIGGVNTTVAQISAQLTRAQIDLDECTIYAPADGVVTQRAVEVGAVTLTSPFASVMNFVYGEKPVVRAIFRSNARRHMQVGDEAEIVFDAVPGVVFQASVRDIMPATGAGTLSPSGDLLTTSELAASDLVLALLDIDDERFDRTMVPIGTGASAAVYADGAKPIRIIRRVVMRMKAWMAYL
jgi:multidrug resistance efflux pump